jgi:hypothetical protein
MVVGLALAECSFGSLNGLLGLHRSRSVASNAGSPDAAPATLTTGSAVGEAPLPLFQGSWNLDLSDLDCGRALSDEERQKLECLFGASGVDEPPDRVAAEQA